MPGGARARLRRHVRRRLAQDRRAAEARRGRPRAAVTRGRVLVSPGWQEGAGDAVLGEPPALGGRRAGVASGPTSVLSLEEIPGTFSVSEAAVVALHPSQLPVTASVHPSDHPSHPMATPHLLLMAPHTHGCPLSPHDCPVHPTAAPPPPGHPTSPHDHPSHLMAAPYLHGRPSDPTATLISSRPPLMPHGSPSHPTAVLISS